MPKTLVCHRKCYGQFTDNNKIECLRKPKPMHSKEEPSCSSNEASGSGRRLLRRAVQPVNWNLCIFCQSADQKARLISVMTKQMSDNILQAAHLDYKFYLRLAGVIDLIAAEAKYHLTCFRIFNRSTTKAKQNSVSTDIAMIWLCKQLHETADKGHVIFIVDAWEMYKELAEESQTTIQQSYFSRSTTFKEKLQSQIGDAFNFFQPVNTCSTERKIVLIPTRYQPAAVMQLFSQDGNQPCLLIS